MTNDFLVQYYSCLGGIALVVLLLLFLFRKKRIWGNSPKWWQSL